jgi:hypothetical protein
MYSIDSQLPSFYERTRAQTVSLPVYSGGSVVSVVSGVFTLRDQSTITVVTGATVQTGGVSSYTVTALDIPLATSLSAYWQEEWVLTFGDGHVETFRRDAYLCLRLLHPTVTEPLLIRRVADLAAIRPPTISSYQPYLDEAWGMCQRRLLQDGKRPYLIMNDYALTDWHAAMALDLIFTDLSTYSGDGRFGERALVYREEAVAAFDRLRLEYDMTEVNTRASSAPSVAARPLIYTNYAPSMAYRPFGPRRI